MATLHDVLTSLSCRHGLLILDCCFSGAFKWSSGFRDIVFDLPSVIYEQRFHQYLKDPAWQVITSSASDQKALDVLQNHSLGLREDKGKDHSPFALALLKGISGDADMIPKGKGDGVITATELYTYLRDVVEDATMASSKRQTPALFSLKKHDKGQYVFLHPRHPFNLPPAPDRNPFMGLKSYNEADASLFYGRDRVILALRKLISRQNFIVVSGASGTGKSSVIKAGLLPNLRKLGWAILPVIRPGKEPMNSLQEQVPDLAQLLSPTNPSVLIIDQYEELITQCLDNNEKEAFEQQLADWLTQYPTLRIIISVRSDFEPQFEENVLSPWWAKGRYIVPSFSTEELREVIIKPTIQEVLFFEPDSLVENLVDAVNQAPGALPLLSFTLSELYHSYLNSGRTNRALTQEDYEKLGGVIGALRTRADKVYNDIDDVHQNSMRQLMLRMVSIEGGELAGKRVLTEDLQFVNPQETARVKTVANQLVEARLVQQGTDTQGHIFIEPAHDALVRAWRRLWEWVKTIGEDKLSWQNKLTVAVRDYKTLHIENPKKAKQLLWNNNPRLDLLKAELGAQNHGFNTSETQFVQKSIQLRTKKQRQFIGGLFGVIAFLIGASIFSFIQKGIADDKTVVAEQQTKLALFSDSLAQVAKDSAIYQAKIAVAERNKAEISRIEADTQKNRAIKQKSIADYQKNQAIIAKNEAIQNAKKSQANAYAVQSQQYLSINPTHALNLAMAGYQKMPTEQVCSGLNDVLSNPANRYYHYSSNTNLATKFSPDGKKLLESSFSFYQDGDYTEKSTSLSVKAFSKGQKKKLASYRNESLTGNFHTFRFSEDSQQLFFLETGGDNYNETIIQLDLSNNQTKKWPIAQELIVETFNQDSAVLRNNLVQNKITHFISSNKQEDLRREFGLKMGSLSFDVADFSPSQSYALLDQPTKNPLVWDYQQNILIQRLDGHDNKISKTVFSEDGKYILTGTISGMIQLWEIGQKNPLLTVEKGYNKITSLAFPKDFSELIQDTEYAFFISGNSSGELLEWSVQKATSTVLPLRERRHNAPISAIALSYGKNEEILVLSADETGKIHLLKEDQNQGQIFLANELNSSLVSSLSFSKDNQFFASFHQNRSYIWSNQQKKLKHTFFSDAYDKYSNSIKGVEVVDFTDGQQIILASSINRLFIGGVNDLVTIWNTQTNTLIDSFQAHQNGIVKFIISANKQKLITYGQDNSLKLWDIKTKQLLQKFQPTEKIKHIVLHPTDPTIYIGQEDGQILTAKINNIKSWKLFKKIKDGINDLTISSDGQYLLVVNSFNPEKEFSGLDNDLWSDVGTLGYLYHIPTGKIIYELKGNGAKGTQFIEKIDLNNDGTKIFDGHRNDITKVAFSPDNQFFMTLGTDQYLMIREHPSGKLITELNLPMDEKNITAFSFSADGQQFLTTSGKTLKLRDTKTGFLIYNFKTEVPIASVALSPDNQSFYIGLMNGKTVKRKNPFGLIQKGIYYKFNDSEKEKYGIDIDY